ncbi:hypothetical protein J6590_062722 [Homalodisca vitripennis]|nr:hypothetical protein J6590_062722 [Homalodisca vitripennis]
MYADDVALLTEDRLDMLNNHASHHLFITSATHQPHGMCKPCIKANMQQRDIPRRVSKNSVNPRGGASDISDTPKNIILSEGQSPALYCLLRSGNLLRWQAMSSVSERLLTDTASLAHASHRHTVLAAINLAHFAAALMRQQPAWYSCFHSEHLATSPVQENPTLIAHHI